MAVKKNYSEEELVRLRGRCGLLCFGFVVVGLLILLGCATVSDHREWVANQAHIRQLAREDSIRQAYREEQERIRRSQMPKQPDTLAPLPVVVEAPPRYEWRQLEELVRSLSNEEYYASVWKVEDGTSAWMVHYEKGKRGYIRRINPETGKIGPATRVMQRELGEYRVVGNKRRRYYQEGSTLVYEVNGVEKERYTMHRTIDLFTPEPVPDGYEDWEDYYYDNEEDLRSFYYGRP